MVEILNIIGLLSEEGFVNYWEKGQPPIYSRSLLSAYLEEKNRKHVVVSPQFPRITSQTVCTHSSLNGLVLFSTARLTSR